MIHVNLPEGTTRTLSDDVTALGLASDISKSFAKRAVGAVVNGGLSDLLATLPDGANVELIDRVDLRAFELIRHDLAHILLEAVQSLWPNTKTAIGPAIEHGFYYDFDRDTPFKPEDLPVIEKKMREIIAARTPFTCEVWTRDQAAAHFKEAGETWELALLDAIPDGEPVKIYRQGDSLDLCRGPHMRHTGDVGTAFKLTLVAGAYWRGDAKNPMLSRIYRIAFANKDQIVVPTVTGAADDYAKDIAQTMKQAGLRVETDIRNEKIGYKVREHALKKIPIQIAVGTQEAEERKVSFRRHGQKQTETLQLEKAVAVLVEGAKSPRQS